MNFRKYFFAATVAFLFVLNNAYGAPDPISENELPTAKPYSGKSGPLHQLIYLDIPGDHRPVDLANPLVAISLTGMVIVLVLGLLVVVKTKELVVEKEQLRRSADLY